MLTQMPSACQIFFILPQHLTVSSDFDYLYCIEEKPLSNQSLCVTSGRFSVLINTSFTQSHSVIRKESTLSIITVLPYVGNFRCGVDLVTGGIWSALLECNEEFHASLSMAYNSEKLRHG